MATAHVRVDGDTVSGPGETTEVHVALPAELAEYGDPYARHRCAHCGEALRRDFEGKHVDTFGNSTCDKDPDHQDGCDAPDTCDGHCGVGLHQAEPAPLAFLHSVDLILNHRSLTVSVRLDGHDEPLNLVVRRLGDSGVTVHLPEIPVVSTGGR